jgi:predicted nucleotidyltransferase
MKLDEKDFLGRDKDDIFRLTDEAIAKKRTENPHLQSPKPDNIILEGITGSKAYGLDNENSDTDIKGIFVAPSESFLGLYPARETHDHTEPDWVYHEVGKFIKLAMGGNPTILELLFLDGYLELTKAGKMLVDNRHLFLSTVVRKSYYGYAYSQMHRLVTRDGSFGNGRNNRYEKHARHCYRLLYQGKELLETGSLTVRVTPEMRKELFAVGKLSPNELVTKFTEEQTKFDAIQSVLPEHPDKEAINKILLRIRKGF